MSLKHPGSKYHEQIKGSAWQRLRRHVFVRDGWTCQRCGRYGRLEVHHIRLLSHDGTQDMSNLTTLCRDCHLLHHKQNANPERWQWRQLTQLLIGEHRP